MGKSSSFFFVFLKISGQVYTLTSGVEACRLYMGGCPELDASEPGLKDFIVDFPRPNVAQTLPTSV